MTRKRDGRPTPQSTSLALSNQLSNKQSTIDKMFDKWLSEVVPPDGMKLKADTASVLNGEGTSKDTARIVSYKLSKDKRNNYRVPVLAPDGTPLMPTKAVRANKWLKEKKAKKVRNKLGIFQIQLLFEPSGRDTQPIVLTDDPGSSFSGIAVISKKAILYSAMLELPGYKKDSKPNIVVNRFGKKIKKYPNIIVERMDKRRELRRGRRYRKTRRRPCRFLNRSKSGKIAPSVLARKRLELKVITELSKIYPIIAIGYEDVKFNHFKDIYGKKGQFFSRVEIGKNWLLKELRKIAIVKIIRGYDTNIRRQQLGLKKEKDKTKRCIESHVTDCIAMGSLMLGLGIERKNKFRFDVITRHKFSRRKLHLEQFDKGGVRRRYGGSTIPFSKLRKGDYVQAVIGKKAHRCWVSGYTKMNNRDYVYVSNFDWKGFGKDGTQTAIVPYNLTLLNRNTGLLVKSLEKSGFAAHMRMDGMVQTDIENAWR